MHGRTASSAGQSAPEALIARESVENQQSSEKFLADISIPGWELRFLTSFHWGYSPFSFFSTQVFPVKNSSCLSAPWKAKLHKVCILAF